MIRYLLLNKFVPTPTLQPLPEKVLEYKLIPESPRIPELVLSRNTPPPSLFEGAGLIFSQEFSFPKRRFISGQYQFR